MQQTKIATCCYCGTRSAFVIGGSQTHELVCSGCAAPSEKVVSPNAYEGGAHARRYRAQKPHTSRDSGSDEAPPAGTIRARLLKGAFDVIEDIFD